MAHVHSNYYYMVEGSPHVCAHVHSNYYNMVEGALMCGSHVACMWQLTCTVITRIWWRGPPNNMHGNC